MVNVKTSWMMCVESWIHSVLWMQGPSLGQTLQDLSLSESRLLSALLTSLWLWAHVKIGINRYRCLIWAAVGLHGRAVSMELSSRQGLTDMSQREITYRKVLYKRWSAIQIHQFMSDTFPLTLVPFKILLNGKMPFKCYIFRSNKQLVEHFDTSHGCKCRHILIHSFILTASVY